VLRYDISKAWKATRGLSIDEEAIGDVLAAACFSAFVSVEMQHGQLTKTSPRGVNDNKTSYFSQWLIISLLRVAGIRITTSEGPSICLRVPAGLYCYTAYADKVN